MDAVVVTHNSAEDLRGLVTCAPLVGAFDRLVVVDNDSSDDTVSIARGAGATVIERQTNDGFGAAANVGVGVTRGEAFCLLNPDIAFLDETVLSRATEHLARPGVGVVAPALRLPDGSLQDSAREVPTLAELLLRRTVRRYGRRGMIWATAARPVPWAVAACWFVRRAAFDAVGGFDVGYRLYFEDVDLCVRLARAGSHVLYVPEIQVEHRHRGESRSSPLGWANRQHLRSAARFMRRNRRSIIG